MSSSPGSRKYEGRKIELQALIEDPLSPGNGVSGTLRACGGCRGGGGRARVLLRPANSGAHQIPPKPGRLGQGATRIEEAWNSNT